MVRYDDTRKALRNILPRTTGVLTEQRHRVYEFGVWMIDAPLRLCVRPDAAAAEAT